MNKLASLVLAGLLGGCLIPVAIGDNDAGGPGGGNGGSGGGAAGGAAGGAGGGAAGGGAGGGGAAGGGVAGGAGGGATGGGGGAGGAGGGSTDGGFSCTSPASCNDDPQMSALAGMCVASTCVCNSGFERNPATGKCKLYYGRYPITATQPAAYALAVEPGQNRAGVAWITEADGGFDVFYRDHYFSAPVAAAAERVATVGVQAGIAVAFRNGNPIVSFLGGGSDGSVLWTQSDAVIHERTATGTWQSQVVATMSNQAQCGNPVSDLGFLVGMWPALAVDGSKTFLAWRDAHNGSFPQQDWAASDVEVAVSATGSSPWTYQCAKPGGIDKTGAGAQNKIVIANGQPALIYSHSFGGPYIPEGVTFLMSTAGGWMPPVKLFDELSTIVAPGPDQIGLAHRASKGFAVVSNDRSLTTVFTRLTTSATGFIWQPSMIVGDQLNSQGADIAFDPSGLMQISMIDCQSRPAGQPACADVQTSIWKETLTGMVGTNFAREPAVDTEGVGSQTRLGFFANGKRAVLYLAGPTRALRLAIER